MARYCQRAYWEDRYDKQRETFEWYLDYDPKIKNLLEKE